MCAADATLEKASIAVSTEKGFSFRTTGVSMSTQMHKCRDYNKIVEYVSGHAVSVDQLREWGEV
jgi:hypothetical protein